MTHDPYASQRYGDFVRFKVRWERAPDTVDFNVGVPTMYVWDIYWAPEGRLVATVLARTERAAIRKTPPPWRKFLGELYARRRVP